MNNLKKNVDGDQIAHSVVKRKKEKGPSSITTEHITPAKITEASGKTPQDPEPE